MQIWNSVESLIMFYCLAIIVVQIYDNKFNNKCIIYSLIYIPIILITLFTDYLIFMIIYPIQCVMNILIIKLSYPKVKIASLIYLYIFLFMSAAISTATIVAILPNNKYLVEVCVYLLMLSLCCLIAFTKIKDKIKPLIEWTPKLIKILILAILSVMALISTLVYGIFDRFTYDNWLLLIQLYTLLMMVFIFLLLPVVINNSVTNKYLKHLTDDYKKQIENQANHYTALAKSNWEIRRFRHDFKNLWIGLNELIAKGETQEALNMLNKCHGSFVNSTDSILKFDTGNGIVDALLSDKQEAAKMHNAAIKFSGAVPSQGIPPTDLCVLFGNTLDNALEACEKLPTESPKTINIVCKRAGGYLFICISNPVIENVEIKNNSIPTTKEDKTLHGFGLYSLEQIVKKHDGELSLTCLDNLFEVSIDLCINY